MSKKMWVPPEIEYAMKQKKKYKDKTEKEDCGGSTSSLPLVRCCALCKSTGERCKNKAIFTDSNGIKRWCQTHKKCLGGKYVKEYHELCDYFFKDHYWVNYLIRDADNKSETLKDFKHMEKRGIDLTEYLKKMKNCSTARLINTKRCWTSCSDDVHEKFVRKLEIQTDRLNDYLYDKR